MMKKRFVTLSLLLPLLSISGAAYADHNYQHHNPTLGKSVNGLVGYDSGVAIYRSQPGMREGRSVAHKPAPKHSIKAPLQGS
jgi:hypothetical protein